MARYIDRLFKIVSNHISFIVTAAAVVRHGHFFLGPYTRLPTDPSSQIHCAPEDEDIRITTGRLRKIISPRFSKNFYRNIYEKFL